MTNKQQLKITFDNLLHPTIPMKNRIPPSGVSGAAMSAKIQTLSLQVESKKI